MNIQHLFEHFYKNKVILVTGGAGAIGRNLCEKLAVLGAEKVIILDNLSSAYKWNIPVFNNIIFEKGDIRNEVDLKNAFKHKPTIVFHLAAFFANQNSVDFPLINVDVNTIGLLKLLEISIKSNLIEKFVFANSEGGAYGDTSTIPYRENEISIDLGSPYYISKLSGEAYCRYYHRQFDLPVSIVRLFNSYGPGEVSGRYRNVIPNFIYWALKDQPLPLTGNESIARDFVYVQDTVNGLLRAGYFQQAIGEAINIATGKPRKIYELASMINEKTGNTAGTKISIQRKWDRRSTVVGDTTKASTLLNFNAQTDFESGLDNTINWFKDNWSNIEKSADFPSNKIPALALKTY